MRVKKREYKCVGIHVLPLLDVEQVFALHGLLQQGPVLQHEGLDLIQQMPVLFL